MNTPKQDFQPCAILDADPGSDPDRLRPLKGDGSAQGSRVMRKYLNIVSDRLSSWMEIIAGIALIGAMLLIGADILGRIFGHPVPGTYEIVSLAGGLIIGLALPATSRTKGHVSTDILLGKLSERPKRILTVTTRGISIVLFLLAGWGMVLMGIRLKAAGEVTAVLTLPFYYVAFAVGGAFLIQSLVLFSEMVETVKSDPER
jgi:TRAP-type C4-dicarboxylate transport system permease small subunit